MQEIAISEAMNAAKAFLSNTVERRAYINREMARMDYESRIEDAVEAKQAEIVRNMLVDGLSVEQIARIAKLPVSEIEKIGAEQ